ncbi:protease complex subunit PrcB family protein [Virgisporangium aurantiacum]|uniref:PrcB C-terminal domain-containing protein n=1 Tax=Virgisporangium aurantiacum TaxID=175570 RepID=A0A8J4E284_9ACTN|nr:protease complex subunit PrcB family protein [Virgisporangium aurantiacum]GIJ56772.1 hypothetical protein Vau01_042880 [Virgisporangium aurantiacum]
MVEPGGFVLLPYRTIDGLLQTHRHLPEGLHIVRDADEWARLWTRVDSRPPSEPPALAVSWQTEMCVVVSLGQRSSGGYFVVIDMIGDFDGVLTVRAWEIRPGPHCGTTRAVTSPFHAVAVRAHPGDGRMALRIAYEDCEATIS